MEEKTTLADWRELFELAGKIKALEPWEHYADGELFAVELPDTQETLYFGFIGMYGTCYGICCYPGDEGLKGHFRTCEAVHNPLSGGAEWVMFEHDALMCYFSDRNHVSASQRKVIKDLGLKFRGSNQWANFTSYRAQMFPDDPDSGEVRKLIQGFRLLIMLLEQVLGGTFGQAFDFAKQFPLCRLDAATKTPECTLMDVPKLDLSYRKVRWHDQERIISLARQKQLPAVFLMDLIYLGVPIGESRKERAGAGLLFLVVEEMSTMILNIQIVNPKHDRIDQCLGWFLNYISNSGKPRCVKVRKEAVWAMLADTCIQCGITIDADCDKDFDNFDEVITPMLSRFRRGY